MAWGYRASSYASAVGAFSGGGGTNQLTVTEGAAVSSGDRIICAVVLYPASGSATPGTPTVSDSVNAGNYHLDDSATYVDGTTHVFTGIFSKANSGAGTPVLTVTAAETGDQGAIATAAYSGLLTSDPGTDVTVHATGTGGSAASGSTAATGAANELVLGVYFDDGWSLATVTGAGTGFTQRGVLQNSSTAENQVQDEDSGASGSTVSSALASGHPGGSQATWAEFAVVYKLSSGVVQDTARPVSFPDRIPLPPSLAGSSWFSPTALLGTDRPRAIPSYPDLAPRLPLRPDFVLSAPVGMIGTDQPRAIPSYPDILRRPPANPDFAYQGSTYQPVTLIAPPILGLYPATMPKPTLQAGFQQSAPVWLIGTDLPRAIPSYVDSVPRLPALIGYAGSSPVWLIGTTQPPFGQSWPDVIRRLPRIVPDQLPNPTIFLVPPMVMVIARRTLTELGTRVGGRQMEDWGGIPHTEIPFVATYGFGVYDVALYDFSTFVHPPP